MRLPSILARGAFLLIASLTLVLAAADAKYPETLTLSYEYVSSTTSKPSTLAMINYDPKTLRYTITSWTPPAVPEPASSESQSSPLLRILLPSGSSTVTTLSTFSTNLKQHINLYLSQSGAPLSASVASLPHKLPSEEEARYLAKVARAKARGKPIPPRPKPEKPKKPKKGTTPAIIPVPEQQVPLSVLEEEAEGKPRVNILVEKPGPAPKLLSRAPPVVDEHGNEVVVEGPQEKSLYQKYWWVGVGVLLVMMVGGGGGDK